MQYSTNSLPSPASSSTQERHPSPPPVSGVSTLALSEAPRHLTILLPCRCVGNCGKEEGGKVEKYSNCKVGAECTNRAFQNKEYVKHQVRR